MVLIQGLLKSQDTNSNNYHLQSSELQKLHKANASESIFTEVINALVAICIGEAVL